ncbi:MAG: RDD family protein [Chromatium okenii]|nr:RDD family protein [Chromatium okenii]
MAPSGQHHVGLSHTVLYAGFWKRLAAWALDLLVLLIASVFIGFIIGILIGVANPQTGEMTFEAVGNLFGVLLSWLYYAMMESSEKQATLGKMALGIKVVGITGNRISFGRASGRYFGKIISALAFMIGYLMVAFTKRKQGLHDLMANCLVINKAVSPTEIQQESIAPGMSGGAIALLVVGVAAIPAIGILAAIAIPAYQDFTVRAKISEALSVGSSVKGAIAEAVLSDTATVDVLEAMSLDHPSSNVEGMRVDGKTGTIHITMAFAPITGMTLDLTPTLMQGGGEISWTCHSEDIPPRYLPTSCR